MPKKDVFKIPGEEAKNLLGIPPPRLTPLHCPKYKIVFIIAQNDTPTFRRLSDVVATLLLLAISLNFKFFLIIHFDFF